MISFRPYTDKEKVYLRNLASSDSGIWVSLINVVFVFSVVFFICYAIIYMTHLPKTPWIGISAVFGLACGLSLVTYMRLFVRKGAYYFEKVSQDLSNGKAEIRTYQILDAIKREEYEDEGIHFYLELSNGSVLFLSGQYLYEPDGSHRFPSAEVQITRAPISNIVFDFKCSGKYFAPTAILPPFSVNTIKNGLVPEDGEVLNIDFENVRRNAV